MRFATLFMAVLIIPLALSLNDAVAKKGEVYRWTDENGVVHFGERSEENANAEQVIIRKSPASSTSSSSVDTSTDENQQQEPQPSIAQQRRDEREKRRQENS